jgi:hypothetical protein
LLFALQAQTSHHLLLRLSSHVPSLLVTCCFVCLSRFMALTIFAKGAAMATEDGAAALLHPHYRQAFATSL